MKHRSDNSIGSMACNQDPATIDAHRGSAKLSDLGGAVGSDHM